VYKKILFTFILFGTSSVFSIPALLFVEGNIGAGKSTFLKMIEQNIPATVTLEPCDEWQNVSGENLLGAYYQDGIRWGALFQIYASMTRVRKQQAESLKTDTLQIMERSWYCDRYCFQKIMYDLGFLDNLSRSVVQELWDFGIVSAPKPVGFIYLRVEPEVCMDRMKHRARGEESGVSLDYLQRLHDYHESLLVDKSSCLELKDIPVLILDGSLNFRDDKAVQQSFVRQILDFLKINGNIDLTK
jgi:deoxyadenosine/deoxycytidine kinase